MRARSDRERGFQERKALERGAEAAFLPGEFMQRSECCAMMRNRPAGVPLLMIRDEECDLL